MNKSYIYEHYEEWGKKAEAAEPTSVELLIQALADAPEDRRGVDEKPEYLGDKEAVKLLPEYHYKTGCYDDPNMVRRIHDLGLSYESLEQGAIRWLVMCPLDKLAKRYALGESERHPVLMVIHREDYFDPFWAAKTVDLYSDLIETTARRGDKTLIFLVPNFGGPAGMAAGLITEGIQNYCGDKNRIYFDVSRLLQGGKQLKDIPGYFYETAEGSRLADPDEAVEIYSDVPVVNYAGRWIGAGRRGLHGMGGAQDGHVDGEWLQKSHLGELAVESYLQQKALGDYKTPEAASYFDKKGLKLGIHHVRGERWVIVCPKETQHEKLPVVICLSEVNEPNESSVLSACFEWRGFCDVAAHGDCAVIFFAMESPELNDLMADIVKDAAELYPLDLDCVYITGHSHNGHFAQEFARRNPKVIACCAPMGNSPGLPTPAVSHEAVAVDDARAALMETMDMPTVILCGCHEVGCLVPINKTGEAFEAGINVEGYAASAEGKIAMWNRRLKAERCPQQDIAAVRACAESPDKAVRELGFPADRTDIVWLDGFEHYVGDLRNVDGNYHFRVVAVENHPHAHYYSMHIMAWNYMRRFARNRETGEVIELFRR